MVTESGMPGLVATQGGDSFGGCGWWGFLILALFFFGGNGFGGFGGRGAAAVAGENIDADIWKSQQLGQIDNSIRATQNGLADTAFMLNNSIKDGTFSVTNGIAESTYHLADKVNGIGAEVARVNYDVSRAIDATNFGAAQNTAAIIAANTANTQKVLDTLNMNEKARLAGELADAKQALMEARIVASQKPVAPIPSYTVPSPYGVYGNGCGC